MKHVKLFENHNNMNNDNIEKLKELGILGDVRQRYGADDENDESRDAEINNDTNTELIAAWCGWHLGDDRWWYNMKNMYDYLNDED